MAQIKASIEIFPERINAKGNAALQKKMTADGPVSQLVQQVSIQLRDLAANLIGKKYSGHHPERGRLLRESGTVVKGSPDGPDWRVVFTHPIARWHRDGTRTHPFKARAIGQKPYFRNTPAGYNFGPVWHGFTHPGTTPNPYLTNAARILGLQPSGGLKRPGEVAPVFRVNFGSTRINLNI